MTATGGKQIVFHAFSAFVGSLRGPTKCAFWTEDPSDASINWAQGRLIEVDLSRNPTAAKAGQISWDDVDVDDFTLQNGLTTIGPLFPGGAVIGAVWLSVAFMNRNNLTEAQKPQHAHSHELKALLQIDAQNKVRRFQGFHAKVGAGTAATAAGGKLTQVQIWNAGTGKAQGHAGHWWLDLDDVSETTASDVPNKSEGSLYLDSDKKGIVLMSGGTGPKIPPSKGY